MAQKIIVSTLLIFSSLLLSTNAYSKNVNIDIVTNAAGCPTAVVPDNPCSAGSSDVCFNRGGGNYIAWRYRGSSNNAPAFSIEMKDPGQPEVLTAGCRQTAKSIRCSISNTAPAGSYSYSVVNDVCTLDPRIIIN